MKLVSESVIQVNHISENTLEKSSFVNIVVYDIVSEPPTKETCHEPSTDQMTPPIDLAKDYVVEPPHVQLDSC